MTEYVHGYGTPEQECFVEQAEHWRHRRAGLEDLRRLAGNPGAGLGWVLHKSTAVR